MTAITWYTLRGTDDPVYGNPAEFESVEQRFATIKNNTSGLGQDFRALGTSGSQFSGAAADAFVAKVEIINTALLDVPSICKSLEDIFDRHAAELRRLQAEADGALARAQTQWNLVSNADTDRSNAQARLQFVDDQLEYLDAQGPAADPADRSYWNSERIEAIDWRTTSKKRRDSAQDLLDDETARWETIRQQEESLDEGTANSLRNMVLWSMGDPSTLEQLGKAVADLYEAFKNFGEYIFSLDLIEDLYHLLEKIIDFLSIVSIVLEVLAYACLGIAALLAPTGVGAAFFGAASAFLLTASKAITLVAMLLSLKKLEYGFMLVVAGRLDPIEFVVDLSMLFLTGGLQLIGGALGRTVAKGAGPKVLPKILKVVKLVNDGAELADKPISVVNAASREPYDFKFDNVIRENSSRLRINVRAFDFDPPRGLYRSINANRLTLLPTGL